MMLERAAFLARLDETIAKHAMLDHPFYQLWNEGKLPKKTIAEYAKQYYAHVRYFPRYVSAVHSACDDIAARQLLLENINDEDAGPDNHPELWMRFADGMGVARDDVRNADLLPETRESVDALVKLTRSDDFRDGLAALYAYESQVPEVSRTKREGLAAFYGVVGDRAVQFFTVHEEADIEHSRVERELLASHCDTPEAQERVLAAAETSAKALWRFLDGVHRAYVLEAGAGQ